MTTEDERYAEQKMLELSLRTTIKRCNPSNSLYEKQLLDPITIKEAKKIKDYLVKCNMDESFQLLERLEEDERIKIRDHFMSVVVNHVVLVFDECFHALGVLVRSEAFEDAADLRDAIARYQLRIVEWWVIEHEQGALLANTIWQIYEKYRDTIIDNSW